MRIIAVCMVMMLGTAYIVAGDSDFYDILFAAVADVESGHNAMAHNVKEDAVGIVQIRRCVIDDVNRFSKVAFTYEDRWDIGKSRQIFEIYIKYWMGKSGDSGYEVAARIWNGGPLGYKKEATVKYWEKVKKCIKM